MSGISVEGGGSEQVNTCLAESDSGPTGDIDSSNGELPVCTSWSKLRLSFLSNPANLPAFRMRSQSVRFSSHTIPASCS
jgi:hypothetical protein